ncbi:MAG: hypothetical protein ACTSRW_13090 [Candidatus Helarchaeota archaeon]
MDEHDKSVLKNGKKNASEKLPKKDGFKLGQLRGYTPNMIEIINDSGLSITPLPLNHDVNNASNFGLRDLTTQKVLNKLKESHEKVQNIEAHVLKRKIGTTQILLIALAIYIVITAILVFMTWF